MMMTTTDSPNSSGQTGSELNLCSKASSMNGANDNNNNNLSINNRISKTGVQRDFSQNNIHNSNNNSLMLDSSRLNCDSRQQDSGSNQSGSDSGLGYTGSSICSDNSTGQSIANNTTGHQLDCCSRSNSTCKRYCDDTAGKNNNSNSESKKGYSTADAAAKTHDLANQGPESASALSRSESNVDAVHHRNAITRSGDQSEHSPDAKAAITKQQSDKLIGFVQSTQTGALNSMTASNQAATDIAKETSQAKLDAIPPTSLPPLKSLLKRSSPRVGSRFAGDASPRPCEHNRNVSFNQTVIVFCEEIDVPIPGGRFEEPSLRFHEPDARFEPPENYCDERISEDRTSQLDNNYENVTRIISNGVSNLTDDQLIGLLENESLLGNLKIDCDNLSADEFDSHNDGNAYLCNDAMSDSGSDLSESYTGSTRNNPVLPTQISARCTSSNTENFMSKKDSFLDYTNSANNSLMKTKLDTQAPKATTTNPLKTLPARVKVSTVENNRRSGYKNEDSKFNLEESLQQQSKRSTKDDSRSATIFVRQSSVKTTSIGSRTTLRTNHEIELDTESKPTTTIKINANALDPNAVQTSNPSKSYATEHEGSQATKNQHQIHETVSPIPKQRTVSIVNQVPTNWVPTSAAIQSSAQLGQHMSQNQSTCQFCLAIESNRHKAIDEPKNQSKAPIDVTSQPNMSQCTIQRQRIQPMVRPDQTQTGHMNIGQPNHFTATKSIEPQFVKQPPTFSQSCVSCLESSQNQHKVTSSDRNLQSGTNNNPTNMMNQPTRSVAAYQLVYVLDQNGNRVRALPLVRPVQNGNPPAPKITQPQSVRPIILAAQNGPRPPNPLSLYNPANATNVSNQLQPIRIVNPASNQRFSIPVRLIDQKQLQQLIQKQQANGQTYVEGNPNVEFKQPMIYYVRQPLGSQPMNQVFANTRAFPDPHEIRRLDGLRGPLPKNSELINDQMLGNTKNQYFQNDTVPGMEQMDDKLVKIVAKNPTRRDDQEDPSFGFSRRPAVKVVNKAPQVSYQLSGILNNQSSQVIQPMNIFKPHENKTPNSEPLNLLPVQVVPTKSQTLDRRNMNQQTPREGLPSRNSMYSLNNSASKMFDQSQNNSYTSLEKQQKGSIVHQMAGESKSGTQKLQAKRIRKWLASRFLRDFQNSSTSHPSKSK